MPAFFSSFLCSLFAISCLSLPPNAPFSPLTIEEPVIPKEIVVAQAIENNENYFSSNDEGIISKTDLEGIVDFEEAMVMATSTVVSSTEVIAWKPIESFAAAPAVYAPKDFAPVDPVGDKYAKWLETAWVNTVTSTNSDNSSTTTMENIEEAIIDDSVPENIEDTDLDTELQPKADPPLAEIIPIIVVTSTPTSTFHIVINAISIGTASSALDEFVEIYNPTTNAISLDGWKLKRVTASGKTENYLVRPFPSDSSIASKQHFLIAHPSGYSTTTNRTVPDLVYTTTSSIAPSNTIILFNGQGEVVDLVGYGEATQFEGAPAAQLSNAGQSLARTEAIDTDHNDVDFKLISR